MADEDTEKRFQQIMEKLFHAPKRSSSSSTGEQSGEKRVKMTTASRQELSLRRDIFEGNSGMRSLVPAGSQAPLCRPWDRGDFMRRLATFKSMTWFGKPKAVSPINCARRGWINIEMDIITCEACGTRLLFSTPSSWTQQQVEKAAAVFSLKLDTGHKLLCPWINNACDEALASFPPTPAPTLVKGYRERCCALLLLSALPVISSSAVDCMKSPQLEKLLAESFHLPNDLNDVIARSKGLVNESESVSANLYYQALKMISLCGWEVHMLPYAVDFEDRTQSAPDGSSSGTSTKSVTGQSSSVVILSTLSDEVGAVNEDSPAPGDIQYDPASVVLRCRFCGARVGLWAFSTVPRPLEFFRVTDSPEVNGQSNSANTGINVPSQGLLNNYNSGKENLDHRQGILSTSGNGSVMSRERPLSLNLSIAGGPPPTKQNFRATVSLPIVGRHLRATFSSLSASRNCKSSSMLGISQENAQCDLLANNSVQHEKDDNMDGAHTRSEDVGELKCNRQDEFSAHIDSDCNAQSVTNAEINEARNASKNEESGDMCHDREPSNDQELPSENPSQCMQDQAENLGRKDTLPKDIENAAVDAGREAVMGSLVQQCLGTPVSNETVDYGKNGNNLKSGLWDNKMEFDPIRQHRYFCPWIASADGTSICGWKLTLSALDHEKELSHVPPLESPSSSFILEDDDPIASVKKLFMSPSEKRMSITRGSK